MQRGHQGTEGGFILTIVVGVALICSVLAYGVLFSSVAQARRTQFYRERSAARYAAEAGLVWAFEQLWQDPSWAGGTLPLGGVSVDVTLPPCGTPCTPRPMTVTVDNS